MTTARRPYINNQFNQMVDDRCLEFKSVPMAVVDKLIKVEHFKNDFTGIKQIYNKVPPRPQNLNALATSIARINNLVYSQAVPNIERNFITQEIEDVRSFVGSESDSELESESMFFTPMRIAYQAEQPTQSSSGVRLVPSSNEFETPVMDRKRQRVSMILGDYSETSFAEMSSADVPLYKRRGRPPGSFGVSRVVGGVIDDILENVVNFRTNIAHPVQSRARSMASMASADVDLEE